MAILNNEYGSFSKWSVPEKSKYNWTNLDSDYKYWSQKEWINAISFYDKHGKLDQKKTKNHINYHLKIN